MFYTSVNQIICIASILVPKKALISTRNQNKNMPECGTSMLQN